MSPIRRVRQKEMRKISQLPRYQVTIALKENSIQFAGTGADICVMMLECAKYIQLSLTNTKTKIQPYSSKPLSFTIIVL